MAVEPARPVIRRRRVLPGFGVTLGCALLYLTLIVLLPLAALFLKTATLSWAELWGIVGSPRTLAAYRVTLTAAALATAFNAAFGLLLAWVLVRYEFPGRRILDALVDLPFALPTAVAGLSLTALLAANGWVGSLLAPLGIRIAYTPAGIAIAMAFTSVPFVVRTIQPVLEDLSEEVEEAARTLGATGWQTFRRVVWPLILPAFIAGASLAFARCLGEFGALVFISGNLPFRTEVVSLLVFIRLEEFDYPAAAALATIMLLIALLMLLVTNSLQAWQMRYALRD